MNRTGAKLVGILVAGLLVGATACGGSSKDDESSDSGKIAATVPDTAARNGNSGLNQLGDDLSALSARAGDCFSASLAFAALAITPLGLAGGATQAQIDQLKKDTEELASEVPSAVEADFQTYADGIQQYANALQGVSLTDITNPETQQRLEDAAKILDSPPMKAAADNIETYFGQTCPSGN